MGVQVHGGMGFIEETGAAQHMRDARILPIYEGTNGIQALDFIGRKCLRDGGPDGEAVLLAEMQATVEQLGGGPWQHSGQSAQSAATCGSNSARKRSTTYWKTAVTLRASRTTL